MKTVHDIWSLLGDDQQQLDNCIIASAKSPVDLNSQVCEYIIKGGGKRIRPLVLLLFARAFEYRGHRHLQLATAIEFIHTATLLHDDVVDKSDKRRNRLSVNAKFGNAAAVLVGDFLYTRAFQLIAHELAAAKVMTDATNELAMGEVMQLMHFCNVDLSEADYLQIIHLKTAVLFSASCRLAAILTGQSDHQEACADYGNYLGKAFQIADDILDYTGESHKMGKDIGDDLEDKKITLPLIHALQHADSQSQKTLRRIIKAGDRNAIAEVIDILNNCQSLDYARRIAYEYADRAKQALHGLPNTPYKTLLTTLPDLAVRRQS